MTPPRLELAAGETVRVELVDCTSGATPHLPTRVALRDLGPVLRIDFDADDPRPWATLGGHDADLWTEEVVEVFVAPGEEDPRVYYELELNPLGTRFDARIRSPHGDRRELRVEREWHCSGLATAVQVEPRRGWRARFELPWEAIGGVEVRHWRLNLFRIDRPREAPAEFSAWSPTRVVPADFHRPACFGFVSRVG